MTTYKNIEILLATKHKKEEAIQKPFEEAFQAKMVVPNDYDTDLFGTFTGEIPRVGSAYETVIKKSKDGALRYGFDFAIANEGSFGPHPTMFFVPADVELMSFIDLQNNLVVVESEITTETNYAHKDITMGDDYSHFLKQIKFGSHGLIIRSSDNHVIAKGITRFEELNSIIESAFKKSETLRLETDMRAMLNPTRMTVINRLALKLVKRLQQTCKQCNLPGFGKVSVQGSLLCEDCGSETELYQYKVLNCVKCNHQEYFARPDGQIKANPKYCPYCNP